VEVFASGVAGSTRRDAPRWRRGDDAVVRVELAPGPALPPGTDLVRHHRVQHSVITGRTHHGSATVLSWYLAAF